MFIDFYQIFLSYDKTHRDSFLCMGSFPLMIQIVFQMGMEL